MTPAGKMRKHVNLYRRILFGQAARARVSARVLCEIGALLCLGRVVRGVMEQREVCRRSAAPGPRVLLSSRCLTRIGRDPEASALIRASQMIATCL